MARRIIQRTKPNPMPPCGRQIIYVAPHSPFQKLIEARRLQLGLTISDVAGRISDLTPHEKPLNRGSFWIWLRNVNGYPHPKSATKTRLAALAKVLSLSTKKVQESVDASRHIYTAREQTAPPAQINALEQLVNILENDKRVYVSRSRVLNMAKSLLIGCCPPSIDVKDPRHRRTRRK